MTPVSYAMLLPSESGFDAPAPRLWEGTIDAEGSTVRELHESALLQLGALYAEPVAVVVGVKLSS